MPKVMPSVLNTCSKPERFKSMVEFSLMKICLKMNKLGKDVKGMFDALDINGDHVLDPIEMMNGLKNRFGIIFSDEEMANMLQFLDSDFSGDIDFKEFSNKISLGNIILNKLNHNFQVDMKKQAIFIINKIDFLSTILKEYKTRKYKDKERIGRDFEKLDKKKKGEIGVKQMKKYLNGDRNITQEYIDEFLSESDSQFKMNKEQFVDWVYQNQVFGFGKEYFKHFYEQY